MSYLDENPNNESWRLVKAAALVWAALVFVWGLLSMLVPAEGLAMLLETFR